MIRRSTTRPLMHLAGLGLATFGLTLVTALIYLPLIDALRLHAQTFGQPLSFLTFPAFLTSVLDHIGPLRWTGVVQALSLWGLITLEGARRGAGFFLGGLIGFPLLLNLLLGTQAEPRVYLFLVPFHLIAAAIGYYSKGATVERQRQALDEGIQRLLLALNKRGNGYASLYEISAATGEPEALQMVTPLSATAIHPDAGEPRYAEVALAMLQAGRTYGIFLTAHGPVGTGQWQLLRVDAGAKLPRPDQASRGAAP